MDHCLYECISSLVDIFCRIVQITVGLSTHAAYSDGENEGISLGGGVREGFLQEAILEGEDLRI